MICPPAVDLAALIQPEPDTIRLEPLAVVFEDGSFHCTTDASCQAAARMGRKLIWWHDQGRHRRIARFFDQRRDILTGL